MTGKSHAKASISRHPLFATVVALWFAALLGLGSLALRASLLEAAVRALQLDLLVPAAAPPLGFTARLLVALLFALAGGLIGFLAARAMAPRRPRPSQTAAPAATQPIVTPVVPLPSDDDNDDLARLEAARDGIPLRRRGLTAQPADERFPPLPPSVPAPSILNLGELVEVEPLGAASESAAPFADAPARSPALIEAAPIDPVRDPVRTQAGEWPAPAPGPLRFMPRDGSAAERLRTAPLDTLGVVELVERFALALAERRLRDAAAVELPVAPPPAAPAFTAAAQPIIPEAAVAPAIAPVPAQPGPTAQPVGAPFADRDPPIAASGRPFDMPAMLRSPLPNGGVDWFGGEPAPAETPLPPRSLAAAPAPADPPFMPPFAAPAAAAQDMPLDAEDAAPGWLLPEPDEDPEGDEAFEDDVYDYGAVADAPTDVEGEGLTERFSSLLDMKPSTRQFGLDPLEPPVRLPPPPSGSPASGTDDALREALATLQRMSGAA